VSATRVQQILTTVMTAERHGLTLPDLLCAACVSDLPVTGAGMALMSSLGATGMVSATDGAARTMEELQFSLGEGPCIDASERGRPVLQPQLRATAPLLWPGFGPAALDAGIEAIFAFPLQVGGIRLGVLDLYRDSAGDLDAADLREALAYADAATLVMLHLQDQMPGDGALHPDLADRTRFRLVVHQATGMVAVQTGVSLAQALLLLRARAYSSERTLADVARDVVGRTLRFGPPIDHDEV
jgi:hypothetical protein